MTVFLYGQVTDFFATTFVNFAVFNVADIFVTCGILLCFVYWMVWDKKQQQGSGVNERIVDILVGLEGDGVD